MPKQKYIVKVDLDSPRGELSNGGLKNVVTLLVRWQIVFVDSYWTSNPAVKEMPSQVTFSVDPSTHLVYLL